MLEKSVSGVTNVCIYYS